MTSLIRRFLVAAAILALASISASAAYIDTCSGIAISALTGGTCTLGDKQFSNFLVLGSANAPAASTITLTGTYDTTDPINPIATLSFGFGTSPQVNLGQSMTIQIGYLVTVNDSSYVINGIDGAITGTVADGWDGGQRITFAKNYCYGEQLVTPGGDDLFAGDASDCPSEDSTFGSVGFYYAVPGTVGYNDIGKALVSAGSSFGTLDVINLVGPTVTGSGGATPTAVLTSAANIFYQTCTDCGPTVPEPATLLLIGAGLLGLGALRRKRA
jgi:hypothetical protein